MGENIGPFGEPLDIVRVLWLLYDSGTFEQYIDRTIEESRRVRVNADDQLTLRAMGISL